MSVKAIKANPSAASIDLAHEILRQAKEHEDSWSTRLRRYRYTIAQVRDRACSDGNRPFAYPAGLLLSTCWNDAIDWARDQMAEKPLPKDSWIPVAAKPKAKATKRRTKNG